MKSLFIIKTGDTFKGTKEKFGDFEDWIKYFISDKSLDIKVIDVQKGDQLPTFENFLCAIITGSHSMVTDNLEWSVKIEKWVKEAKTSNVPIFGICYGHQLIAKALDGEVDFNPKGKEIGTMSINRMSIIKDDILFKNTPKSFLAHTTHSQTVVKLPENSVSLAYNEIEKNHIVRYSDFIWGVQFHPEFDEKIMREYIIAQKSELRDFNDKALINKIENTSYANSLIDKFINIAKEK